MFGLACLGIFTHHYHHRFHSMPPVLLADKVVDCSIGPSPRLFKGHALVCFDGISWSIHLNIYLDLFEEVASLISVVYLKYRT